MDTSLSRGFHLYVYLNYLINIIWLIFDKEKKKKENHYDKCAHRYMWMDRWIEMGWAKEKLCNFTRKIVASYLYIW
jgi:hypothetical protein